MKQLPLVLGDLCAIALVTLIGFATHGEAVLAFIPRMAVLFIPLAIAWFVLAPWFGLFRTEVTVDPRQIWRPALAMIFAAPAAVIARGLLLNTPIIPIFGVVLSATSGLGMLLWRALALLLVRKLA